MKVCSPVGWLVGLLPFSINFRGLKKNPLPIDRPTDQPTDDGQTDGRMDGLTDGQTDRRTDGRTDGWTLISRGVDAFKNNYIETTNQ